MAWEPIEITEVDVRAFAEKAYGFYSSLDERGKAMCRHVIVLAGGNVVSARHGDGAPSESEAVERITRMLHGVWEPGMTIAPLYSGDMPRTGGGTID